MKRKKQTSHHFITVHHKKYAYNLTPINKRTTHVICSDANIDQEFLNEDIAALLLDLPSLILAEKKYKKEQSDVIRFRVSPEDKKYIEQKANQKGFKNVSGFLRKLALEA